MENIEKKEIKIEKSKLGLIFKCLILSILSVFIVQHFGKIEGGSIYLGANESSWCGYTFTNPINGKTYCYKDNVGSTICHDNFFELKEQAKLSYLSKLKDFYLPALFGSLIHIIVLSILIFIVALFFKKFSIKLE